MAIINRPIFYFIFAKLRKLYASIYCFCESFMMIIYKTIMTEWQNVTTFYWSSFLFVSLYANTRENLSNLFTSDNLLFLPTFIKAIWEDVTFHYFSKTGHSTTVCQKILGILFQIFITTLLGTTNHLQNR